MLKLYKIPQIADFCGVKPPTVYSWIRAGYLEAVRVGRLLRVTQEQLDAFLKRGRTSREAIDQPRSS